MLRDGKWKNMQFKLIRIDSHDTNKLIVREDFGNLNYGELFHIKFDKIKKYMKEYQEWEQEENRKKVKNNNPYFVAKFPFHKDYKGVQFLLSNMREYLNQFISENNLRELEDDEEVEIILSLNKHFERDPENTTDDEKWEKFRELIRKMYRNGTNSGS